MGKKRAAKNAASQAEIMCRLHEDAAQHLEMMRTLAQAQEKAPEPLQRQLCAMMGEEWQAYLDATHLMAVHDDALHQALKNCGMDMRQASAMATSPTTEERQLFALAVLPFLLLALAQRHRFLFHRWGWRGDEMASYMSASTQMTKDHIAVLTATIHNIIM